MDMDMDMDMEEGIGDEEMGEFYMAEEIDKDKIDPEYLPLSEMIVKRMRESMREIDNGDDKGFGDDQIDRSFPQIPSGWCVLHPSRWRIDYEKGLCGRLGLYCYNFQKGTNYEFVFVRFGVTEIEYREDRLLMTEWTMLEAVNPVDSSLFFMETQVMHNNNWRLKGGEAFWWETLFCREEDLRGGKYDEWDNEAIDDQYKGELPKWLSDVDKQQCYVVEESEFKENESLHLFAEIAFFSLYKKHCRPSQIAECLPLEIEEVIVETRGEAETEPREKLNAANAIFYISFECRDEPWEGKHFHYRAVVRKTMDGKPGHVRLEVLCWGNEEGA